MRQFSITHLILTIVSLFCVTSLCAQTTFSCTAPVLTTVDKMFEIEFTVSTINTTPDDDSFKAPSFDGFQIIVGPVKLVGHSMKRVNGEQTADHTFTYTYILKATEYGIKTIGAATICVDGKPYRTKRTRMLILENIGRNNRKQQ